MVAADRQEGMHGVASATVSHNHGGGEGRREGERIRAVEQ